MANVMSRFSSDHRAKFFVPSFGESATLTVAGSASSIVVVKEERAEISDPSGVGGMNEDILILGKVEDFAAASRGDKIVIGTQTLYILRIAPRVSFTGCVDVYLSESVPNG